MTSKAKEPRTTRYQRGVAFLETIILVPVAIATYAGIVATNTAVNSNRAVEWAIGEALLENDLHWSPRDVLSGSEYGMRYFVHEPNQSQRVLYEGVSGNGTECSSVKSVECAGWWTLNRLHQALHSSQLAGIMSDFDVRVRYEHLGVNESSDPNLTNFRKITVTVTGNFSSSGVDWFRKFSGIGSLLKSWTVSRTESLG